MKFYILFFIFILFFLSSEQRVVAQVPTNPASVDVNSLSDAQIQKIMQEIQNRGLTQDQAISMAKAQGASQTQIDQLMARIQGQQMNPSDTLSGSRTNNFQTNTPQKVYTSPKARVIVSAKNKKIFGYQLFNSEKLSFDAANSTRLRPARFAR